MRTLFKILVGWPYWAEFPKEFSGIWVNIKKHLLIETLSMNAGAETVL